jgi:hypothetical protein
MREVKTLDGIFHPAPNADGEPEQVLQSLSWSASMKLLTSDAVFEPMRSHSRIIFGG